MAVSLLERYRHAQLLAVLGLLLVANPFAEHELGELVVDALLLVALISAIVACATMRHHVIIGVSLAVLLQAAGIYRDLSGITAVNIAYSTAGIVFFGYVTALVLKDVFRQTQTVSADTICGALSAYLLIGVGWSFAYALLDGLIPGSIEGLREAGRAGYDQYLGYSFVTLTTLGYGNVVPGNAKADALASAEAIVGQVYLTVLVARLVALNLVAARGGAADDRGAEGGTGA
jgi:hypothetical protein